MENHWILNSLLHFLVFFIGVSIGSFLYAVIHRQPAGTSMHKLWRLACPACNQQIPLQREIPVLGWMTPCRKCPSCGFSISLWHMSVNFSLGLLFYAVFLRFGGAWHEIVDWWPMVISLWTLLSLLAAGCLQPFILSKQLTIGGTLAGLICAFCVPEIVGEATHLRGVFISFLGATFGFGICWIVLELGRIAYSRKRHGFDAPEPWVVTNMNDQGSPEFKLMDEVDDWTELFNRESDRLILNCPRLKLNEREFTDVKVEIKKTTLKITRSDGMIEKFDLESIDLLEGTTSVVVRPREAMGFAVVFFIMMIGSFLGWKAVVFTILVGSLSGSLLAVLPQVFGKREWIVKLPFSPYLAAGAVLWVFYGARIWEGYFSFLDWARSTW